MSLALVMIAVAVLPAALAATCTGSLMAVAGVADKCFWYAYQDVPRDIMFLSDLCHKGAEAFGREGRLFRPRSRDELDRVNTTMIPEILNNAQKVGYPGYPVDFFKYEQYGQTVWGTLTYPFELMAPGMWIQGEPNNLGGHEDCASYWKALGSDDWGINDINCGAIFHSVICEFPSEN